MSKDFLQEYFHADFKGIDSLLNEVLVPIFGDVMPGYTEITATETMREKAKGANIQSIKHAATLWADGYEIKVFDVTLYDKCHIHIARKNIQTLIRQYVEHFEGALIAFHYANPEKRSWRLSYLEKRSSNNDSTSAKRYTYLCGRDYACRTIAERFAILAAQEKNAINIDNAFSVEALSNEFFTEYKSQYSDFCNYIIDNRSDETKFGVEFATCEDKFIRDYVKKMMGRLTFLHFLQKKGWMGQPRSIEGWGEGNINFLHDLFDKASDEQKDNFLDEILEPLFFECLNEKRDGDFFDTQVSGIRIVKIPYLNGGLFEKDSIDAPRSQFPREMFQRLFDFYGRYNFTIDENDPLDTEVGVDPEMLGKIFENLLEDNKDKGAFYTPKEIVQYMCKEALIAYLVGEAKKKSEASKQSQVNFEEAIRAFVNDPELTVPRIARYSDKQLHDLKESLENVKICDPAIGSGAFPMGLLNLLVSCREAINTALRCGEPRSYLKQQIILNNIYGVDIEKGAIDIARLRFWLSIVVDEDEPTPLPNFDYKFMQGNSLLEQFEGLDLSNMFSNTIDLKHKGGKGATLLVFDEEATQRALLHEKMKHYFTLNTDEDKHDIRKQVNKAVVDLVKEKTLGKSEMHEKLQKLDVSANDQFFLWHTWFADVFEQGGFDIVIGNPPYIRQEKLGQAYKSLLTSIYPSVGNGTADLYVYFFGLGIKLLKHGGSLAYITLNKYLKTKYGKELRNTFANGVSVDKIIDFFELPIFNAATDAAITILSNNRANIDTRYFPVKTLENLDLSKLTKGSYLHTVKNESEWQFVDDSETKLLEKIQLGTITLKQFCNNRIYRGITTGLNQAFVLKDPNIISDLIKSDSKAIVKHYAAPTSIKRWTIEHDNHYFLATGYDLNIEKDYPTAYHYLQQFEDDLEARCDQGLTKYNLRACAYYNEMEQTKLIYIHTAKDHQFFLDTKGHYINNSCYMIVSDSRFLWCFLNSKLFKYYKKLKFVAYGDGQEAGRCKLDYNKMVTVPVKNNVDERPFYELTEQVMNNPNVNIHDVESQIEELIYDLYGLSEEEKEMVNNA